MMVIQLNIFKYVLITLDIKTSGHQILFCICFEPVIKLMNNKYNNYQSLTGNSHFNLFSTVMDFFPSLNNSTMITWSIFPPQLRLISSTGSQYRNGIASVMNKFIRNFRIHPDYRTTQDLHHTWIIPWW